VRPTPKEDLIEVEIGGARVLLRGNVDPASLRSLLAALRERA
jgi:transposase